MKRTVLIIVALICCCMHNRAQGYEDNQCENNEDNNFLLLSDTNDQLYWKDGCYLMGRSPLSCFPRYDSLYPSVSTYECIYYVTIGEYSMRREKNYYIDWLLVDSTLYLNKIHFYDQATGYFPFDREYRIMEKLTGNRFSNAGAIFLRDVQTGPFGLMPASWFTGMLYAKKTKAADEDLDEWVRKPFVRFLFRHGKLCDIQEIDRLKE